MRKQIKDNLAYLKQIYKLEGEEVEKQLLKHKRLIKFFMEAPDYIYEICGSDVSLFLEYFVDFEAPDFDQLWLTVKVKNISVEEAIRLEDKLFWNWQVHFSHYLNRWVGISVENE